MTEQQDSPAPEVPPDVDAWSQLMRRNREAHERMRQRLTEAHLERPYPPGIPCE